MKRKYIGILAIMLVSFFGVSCKKDKTLVVIDIPLDAANNARIKYFNFASSAPSVNIFANGTKVGGVLSATGSESTAGITYGTVYPSANYSAIVGGTYKINAQIPANAATSPNVSIAEMNVTLDNTKYYSFYLSGIYNGTSKTSDSFLIEDKLPATSNELTYVRFVNAISNGTQAMNLVVKNSVTNVETVVATNIAYKTSSEFVGIPVGIYEIYIRYPSSPINIISRNASTNGTISLQAGRTYTIGCRGDLTVTSATATNRPLIDNTANR